MSITLLSSHWCAQCEKPHFFKPLDAVDQQSKPFLPIYPARQKLNRTGVKPSPHCILSSFPCKRRRFALSVGMPQRQYRPASDVDVVYVEQTPPVVKKSADLDTKPLVPWDYRLYTKTVHPQHETAHRSALNTTPFASHLPKTKIFDLTQDSECFKVLIHTNLTACSVQSFLRRPGWDFKGKELKIVGWILRVALEQLTAK